MQLITAQVDAVQACLRLLLESEILAGLLD